MTVSQDLLCCDCTNASWDGDGQVKNPLSSDLARLQTISGFITQYLLTKLEFLFLQVQSRTELLQADILAQSIGPNGVQPQCEFHNCVIFFFVMCVIETNKHPSVQTAHLFWKSMGVNKSLLPSQFYS